MLYTIKQIKREGQTMNKTVISFEKQFQKDLLKKQKEERKWALVCQGGGFKGAWEAGFLTAIRKISDFDIITHIGTSIGGINAALMIASRQNHNIFEQVWEKITLGKIFCLFRSHKRLKKLFLPNNIADQISNIIEQDSIFLTIITSRCDKKLTIEHPFLFKAKKYHTTSFDEHDKITDSLLATASMPIIFPKKTIQEKNKKDNKIKSIKYKDGGIVSNNPLKNAKYLNIQNILVLAPSIKISRNESILIKFIAKIPKFSIPLFIDAQVVRTIQNVKEYVKKEKYQNLKVFICKPSEKLKTCSILATKKSIFSDFNLGLEDGKKFIEDFKNSNAQKYDIKNITLEEPIKNYYDKKVGKTIIYSTN